jgi:hypothetical protein
MREVKLHRRPVKAPPYAMSGRQLNDAVQHMPSRARAQLARELVAGAISVHRLTAWQAAKICAAPARTAE